MRCRTSRQLIYSSDLLQKQRHDIPWIFSSASVASDISYNPI
ncbi:Protein of unknown function [Pyronema omphalodes CBS 100304]|uniref:Uncharacterized protein n=1 Tax=Pyronema omphalodes (strain CBS 100304) TaxID=1076935 RepID=U4KWT5_PYROM|nr:Protein of unknown function [Pyronema omphalodes CBS 100304]